MTDELKPLLDVATAEAAQTNLDALAERVTGYEKRLREIQIPRKQALLDGDKAKLAALADEVASLEMLIERAGVIGEELEARKAQLQDQEGEQADQAAVQEGEQAAKRGLKLTHQYAELAGKLGVVVHDLEACYGQIGAALRIAEARGWEVPGLVFPHSTFDRRDLIKEGYKEFVESNALYGTPGRKGHYVDHAAEYDEAQGINLLRSRMVLPPIVSGQPAFIDRGA